MKVPTELSRRDAIIAAAGGAAVTTLLHRTVGGQEAISDERKPGNKGTGRDAPLQGTVSARLTSESWANLGSGAVLGHYHDPDKLGEWAVFERKIGDICWMEVRIHWQKPCRDCRAEVWVEMTHPRLAEIRAKIEECLRAGAVAAAIATILSAAAGAGGSIPTAAATAFYEVFVYCLEQAGVDFARQIAVSVNLRNKDCEDWTANCEPCD